MAHLALIGQREQFLVNLVLGDGGEAERRHELGAPLCQDHPEREAALPATPDQLQRLIGGNAAGDDQQDPLARQHWTSKFHSSCQYLAPTTTLFKFAGITRQGSVD